MAKIVTHLDVHEANTLQVWWWRRIRKCTWRKIALLSSDNKCEDQNCGIKIADTFNIPRWK